MDEEHSRLADQAFDILEAVATEDREAVRVAVGELEISAANPMLCERLLRLSATVEMGKPLAADIVRAGATASPAGAHAALALLTFWRGPDVDRLMAADSGVAAQSSSIECGDLVAAIQATHDVAIAIDQLGLIAELGAPDLASKCAAGAGVKRHPVRELFAASRRVSDLERVSLRLGYVTAWKARTREIDGFAIDGYLGELRRVDNAARLRIVLASMLSFFPEPSRLYKRKHVRKAMFDALDRVSPIDDEELQAELEQARTQLALETGATAGRVTRIFDRVFGSS